MTSTASAKPNPAVTTPAARIKAPCQPVAGGIEQSAGMVGDSSKPSGASFNRSSSKQGIYLQSYPKNPPPEKP
jgi:hypothetical protein